VPGRLGNGLHAAGSFSAQLGLGFHGLGDCTLTLRGWTAIQPSGCRSVDTGARSATCCTVRDSSTELELGCIPLTGDEARHRLPGSHVGVRCAGRARGLAGTRLQARRGAGPLLLSKPGKNFISEPAPERCQPALHGHGSRPSNSKGQHRNDHDQGVWHRFQVLTVAGIRPCDYPVREDAMTVPDTASQPLKKKKRTTNT